MQKALRDLWRETSEDKHANDRGRAKQRFYSGCFRFLRLYAGFKLQLIQVTDRCSQLFESTVRKCSILPAAPSSSECVWFVFTGKGSCERFPPAQHVTELRMGRSLSLALTHGCSHQARCEALDNVKSEKAE